MLAELNGPVPRISLKIDLVVSVIIKDLPQAVYRPYRFDSLVGNTGEGFAVGIVPACPWHKGINQVFEMLVGQSQILPGVQIETSRIHMDMEPATVIHFCITDVKHPAYRFQLFQAILTHQYRADRKYYFPAGCCPSPASNDPWSCGYNPQRQHGYRPPSIRVPVFPYYSYRLQSQYRTCG